MDKGAETMFWVEEFEGQVCAPLRAKRKYRSKRKEFVGWASKQLIEFLETIGKETSKQLSQYDVTAIINEYANANRLHHPQKKKRIVCDDKLHFLFGRKTIGRNKIHDLLAVHFAENQEDSDDDFFYSSDEREESILPASEQIKFSTSERKPKRKKVNPGPPKSCFAAIVPENIKLVYLRKCVVLELLKDPESFEDKMIGSFIRIKCDPNDFLQKNSHQLLQVTGVKNISGTDDRSKILLKVTNSIKDVQISMLSDDNFSEEECKDLLQRMKDGLLKKPTIGDLEGKAQMLHVDITKHWLERELVLLQNRIDRANEKGWRRELYEHLDQKKLLQTPSEQTRLFSEVPKVVAEEIEAAITPDLPDTLEQEQNASPISILSEASETPVCQAATNDNTPTWISSVNQRAAFVPEEQPQPPETPTFGNTPLQNLQHKGCNDTYKQIATTQVIDCEDYPAMVDKQVVTIQAISHEGSQGPNEQTTTTPVIEHNVSQSTAAKKLVITEVIDLSDDDEEENENPQNKNPLPINQLGTMSWYYADPQGDVQGPFSLLCLKKWSDANYFSPEFMVWKKGQCQDDAVLLRDVLGQAFPI